MKTWKDMLQGFSEAATLQDKVKMDNIVKIIDLNKDRVGKPALDIDGKEIPKSIVLAATGTFAIKTGNRFMIDIYSKIKGTETVVSFGYDEIKLLKSFI